MKLTVFQSMLYRDLEPDVWYDCYVNQGTGGKELPDWFHRSQPQCMSTLMPMVEAGALTRRFVDGFMQVKRGAL